jgi:quercetin dioxygenase-like cupin family protein
MSLLQFAQDRKSSRTGWSLFFVAVLLFASLMRPNAPADRSFTHSQEGSHSHHSSIVDAHGGAPRPAIVPISSEALPHIAGKRITTVRVDFPPRGRSPKHHHGGSVSVYVLSGTIRSQLEGGPVGTYTVGDMFFEPPGVTHVLAENVSATEAATILAVFVHDEGATLTTYHE